MENIPTIYINECNVSNQQSEVLKSEPIKSEIMSLWDIFTFIKNIPSRLKKLYIFNMQLEINKKETRIDISIVVFLFTMIYPTFIRLVYGILGFIISYQLYYKYGASKTGELVFGMLKFSKVHIHQWLYCSISLIIFWTFDISHPFFIGLGFGGIVHGIQFSDWSNVIL